MACSKRVLFLHPTRSRARLVAWLCLPLAALAIARWMGCPTAVTSRHQSKLDRARQLGADFAVLGAFVHPETHRDHEEDRKIGRAHV